MKIYFGRIHFNICRSIFLIAIILCIGEEIYAQELWRGTIYGMSAEEVLRKVPEAKFKSGGSFIDNGAQEILRMGNIEIVGEIFYAAFYFLNNRLDQVSLVLDKKQPINLALIIFDTLTDVLRSKYGKELSLKIEKDSSSAYAKWKSGKTNINLYVIGVGNNPASLSINYQVRLVKEADKL